MTTQTASEEANKELVRTEMEKLLEQRDFEFVDDIYAETVEIRTRRAGGRPVVSREDLKSLYAEWTDAFPDLTVEIHAELADGDLVVQQVTLRGTHEGTFRGVEPTGAVIDIDGFHLREIRDGTIVATSSVAEMATLMTQLGLDLPFDAM